MISISNSINFINTYSTKEASNLINKDVNQDTNTSFTQSITRY